jgi:NAD(P)-dependent dehydrogenase (short-subunit alcohol dehydrogenase family)
MPTVAVVTGAGRGLGLAIAERLAARGHRVVVTDIDGASARATATALGAAGHAEAQDVRDPDSHRRIAAIAAGLGEVALWINNAGVLTTGAAWEIDDDAIRREVDVNVLGVIWGCRAAIDAMAGRGGHIVNIASLAALVPAPGLAAYGATKHAVLGYTLGLAGELRGRRPRIDVSAVCPDVIDTQMVRAVADREASNILFSSKQLLTVDRVADRVLDVVARPRLVTTIPPVRAALAHALRPFPAVGLRLLAGFARVGARHRKQRSS